MQQQWYLIRQLIVVPISSLSLLSSISHGQQTRSNFRSGKFFKEGGELNFRSKSLAATTLDTAFLNRLLFDSDIGTGLNWFLTDTFMQTIEPRRVNFVLRLNFPPNIRQRLCMCVYCNNKHEMGNTRISNKYSTRQEFLHITQ